MEHLNENRGVAGYQQPKKRKDYNPYPQGEQLLGQGGDDYLSSLRRGVDIGGDYIKESQRRWNEWSPENGEQTLLNRQKESQLQLLLCCENYYSQKGSFIPISFSFAYL